MAPSSSPPNGAKVIAQALYDLGVTVIHTLVGIPVAEIAEEAIDLGIRVIGYRNEQACTYAASAYGYLTGRPGVCILTGGPGILHGMAGIGNASTNAFPLLVLGGSTSSSSVTKGGFQELDAVALLTPHTKFATRPTARDPPTIITAIRSAYRIAWYGRPGPTFVDLPTEMIMEPTTAVASSGRQEERIRHVIPPPPTTVANPVQINTAAQILKSAKAPLVIIGKGAAYSRSEASIRTLIATHNLPFLPTPMGKGVVPDSSPLNVSSARSVALRHADVILLLGARLNWILHFGEAPRYRADVKLIQVDVSPEELGRENSRGEVGISLWGDVGNVVEEIGRELGSWKSFSAASFVAAGGPDLKEHEYLALLSKTSLRNVQVSRMKSNTPTVEGQALTYERAYHVMRTVLDGLSPPETGGIVYVSEGANTMDISRSMFPLEVPRHRLDAGTWGTMGVGMGYAIAAWAAHNLPPLDDGGKRKKIIALEGDSAFGFSGLEIETMARHAMDIVIVIMNNSGIYKGDAHDRDTWAKLQAQTVANGTGALDSSTKRKGLRSTSLLHETRYEKMADMVGGRGWLVRTEKELATATREAFLEKEKVCVLNVIIDPGLNSAAQFGWFEKTEKDGGGSSKL